MMKRLFLLSIILGDSTLAAVTPPSCDDESMGHNAVNELAQLERIWEITKSKEGPHHRPALTYKVQPLPLATSDGCLRWLINERAAVASSGAYEVGGSSLLAEIHGEAMLRLCA